MKEKSLSKVRVLVVDDSSFLRQTLPRILSTDPEIEVVGTAANGREAVDMVKALKPNVVTLDVVMPVMDGLEALKIIMRDCPTPVVMLSSTTYEGSRQAIEALSLGAIDFVTKPSGPISPDIKKVRADLIQKVRTAYLSKIKQAARVDVAADRFRRIIEQLSEDSIRHGRETAFLPQKEGAKELIAIATSTGGPMALQKVFSELPRDLPAGVVIVQHIAQGFSEALAERLDQVSLLDVRVCKNREPVLPGTALLAPAGMHLSFKRLNGQLYAKLSDEPSNTLHRPAADIMFETAAEVCGTETCAVIMTGMGDDGARGIKAVRDAGGHTIAQDEASCVVYGMPRVAIEKGGIQVVAPLEAIAKEIIKVFK